MQIQFIRCCMHLSPYLKTQLEARIEKPFINNWYVSGIQGYRDSSRIPLCLSNFTKLTAHCVAWPTVPYPGLLCLYCANIQDFHLFIVLPTYVITRRILSNKIIYSREIYRDSIYLWQFTFCTNQRSHTHRVAIYALRVS